MASHEYIKSSGGNEAKPQEDSDDQRAIREVLEGNVNAYAFLVRRYQKPIFDLMFRMTGSYEDARDLAQEVFVKAYEKIGHFRTNSRFLPWLYTIGLNHAKNFMRKKKLAEGLNEEIRKDLEPGENPKGEEDRLSSRIDSRKVQQALQKIPLEYREALILYYHEGLSVDEVATALTLSISGAKMRIHRGLKKLRDILIGNSR